MIRLLIVDDHAIVREGLRILLGEPADLDLVGEAADGPAAVAMAAVRPDCRIIPRPMSPSWRSLPRALRDAQPTPIGDPR
jgi:DNA-binding NarL/FixJ family response regulator